MNISIDALNTLIEERCSQYYINNKNDIRHIYSPPYTNEVVLLVFDTPDDCLCNKYTTDTITTDDTFEFSRTSDFTKWQEKGSVAELKSKRIYSIAVRIKSIKYIRYTHLDPY